MKKSKLFKTISFSSLALLMGIAGTMAFAPLGASPNNLANASEMVDQINTKADGENIKYAPSALGLDPENDPVIYTTESGLEIKYGGATTALGGGDENVEYDKLPNGKPLSGYPYFTMGTYSGYAVNWVIIGKATNVSDKISYDKLSNWQTKTSESPTFKKFFESTYEATTPAGVAIKNGGLLNDYTARKQIFTGFDNVKSNSEIPSGCVLVISECHLGTSYWAGGSGSGQSRCYTDARTIRANMDTLYNNNFKSLMDSRIVVNTTFAPYSNKMFPLQSDHATTLLTTDALRVTGQIDTPTTAQAWWLGNWYGWTDNYYQGQAYHVNASGGVGALSFNYTYYENTMWHNIGMRPACIIQLK